ncbi:App1 family protein [Maribacter sp. CXY002]|uniref:App1 family protein n=1 Tax=Maribacter luteocoastalis TaxID=3407671 RepID=UPI003B685392
MGIITMDKIQIIGFQSYGTRVRFYARGRALEDENIDLEQKGIFNLLLNTWKRFETDEVKNTPIKINFGDNKVVHGTTDHEGYYLIKEDFENVYQFANEEGWVKFEISFTTTDLKREILNKNIFPGEMLIPKNSAKFGVISDIDDTILHTGVVSSLKWKVVINTIFRRAISRKALEGTADFYHQLHRGKTGTEANPVFYVSHSPWNLYRYLELFLKTNAFPKGPILLRSMSSFRLRKNVDDQPQKQKEITNILKTYPHLSFILIGDSGEKDADIYLEITKMFPNRVKAIYLRSVADRKRMKRVADLFTDFNDIPYLIVGKTAEAITHAKTHGFI